MVDFTIREKVKGWRTQVLRAYFENGKVWTANSGSHFYYYYFLNNYSLRDSCYTCDEYSSHSSDITLADHWLVDSSFDDDRGTSLIIANTAKGEDVVLGISSMINENNGYGSINYETYSHSKYDYSKKKKWIAAYCKGGFEEISTSFFRKRFRLDSLNDKIRRAGGITKTACRKILRIGAKAKK